MSPLAKDVGIIAVLVKRLEDQGIPAMLDMEKKLDAGDQLSDADIELLHGMLDTVQAVGMGRLLERHPDYVDLAGSVFRRCRQIVERACASIAHTNHTDASSF